MSNDTISTSDTAVAEAAQRLEQVVDDSTPRQQCSAWVHEQLVAGRDADELLAELLGNGWPQEDAESIVEGQRRATRHLRGCVTRAQVAAVAEKRYRHAFRYASRMAFGGIMMVCLSYVYSVVTKRMPWP